MMWDCAEAVAGRRRNTAGFPRIQHGGLTAAIIDESFGFLWLSLRSHGLLPFRGPAFTVHLEVSPPPASCLSHSDDFSHGPRAMLPNFVSRYGTANQLLHSNILLLTAAG